MAETTLDAAPISSEAGGFSADYVVLPGDRLIVGVWIALAVTLGRAIVQGAVDALSDGERGAWLVEHFIEHLLEASGRAWLVIPPLAILPRGKSFTTAALRVVVAFGLSIALLAGFPDGEGRYTPGLESRAGLIGWAAIVALATFIAAVDRYATSPRRSFFRNVPTARTLVTAAVVLLGSGAVATATHFLELDRQDLTIEVVDRDLLELLQPEAANQPGGLQLGAIQSDRGDQTPARNRPAALLEVGTSATCRLVVPADAELRFSVDVDKGGMNLKTPPTGEVTFAVAVNGRERFTRTLALADATLVRRGYDVVVPLAADAGTEVTLTFSLRGNGGDCRRLRAGFARPRIVHGVTRPRTRSTPERKNLVLVLVDGLRPDHLAYGGYARAGSLNIDRLAAESLNYSQAYVPSSLPWPVVASLFTGRYPPSHGVVDSEHCFLSDSLPTLAEVLQQAGYTTLGVSANPLFDRSKNFSQGFEVWREYPFAAGPRLAEEFGVWTRRYRDYQFFACVHLHDPARPFTPPAQWASRFASPDSAAAMRHAVNQLSARARGEPLPEGGPLAPSLSDQEIIDLYDAEVACVDAQIARMRRDLEESQLWDRTVFVVVGTYGEWLGSGPVPRLGGSLARDLLHVPLLLHDPDRPAAEVAQVVDLTQLAATLLRALDLKSSAAGALGPTLLPPFAPGSGGPAFAYTALGELPENAGPLTLLGWTDSERQLVLREDGTQEEFVSNTGEKDPPGTLIQDLRDWLELCRRDQVTRPFELPDPPTRTILNRMRDAQVLR